MLKGRFMGITWTVGDSLCMKVLTFPGNPKKQGQIPNRGAVCPRTPGDPFHEQMLCYLKDKFFPCVVGDNLSSIGGTGKQGAENYVLEDDMGHPPAKRAKSNAGAVIQTTPPMQMGDMGIGAAGESKEGDAVNFNSLVADKPCLADSNMLETGKEDSVSNDEIDPVWEGMHGS
jgi:hypothetical protein